MVKAARESKAILTIGQHMRFSPQNQFIHKARLAGELGEIYFARAIYHRRGGVPWWGQFHVKSKSGGGAMIDIGVHVTDLALWLMGSPKPVQVSGVTYAKFGPRIDGERPNQDPVKAKEFDVDDFASAYVRMDNGATLTVEVSWAANRPSGPGLELYGDQGGVTEPPLTIFTQRHGKFVNITPDNFPKVEGHGAATAHFIKVIEGEADNLVLPEETHNVQKILDGVYKSSLTGKPVIYKD
jgi:predicted dehydrogenase